MPRSRLEELEGSGLEARSGELLVVLVWLVAADLGIEENDLNAARRRAMFVLAAGGDPHRELDHDSIAAERLSAELDTPERRRALSEALDALAHEAEGLSTITEALDLLRSEPDLAWRSLALALLADELAEE
ncbi:MAG TPA: hypothetical protein VHP82_15865 [Gaiellaceae bacterium]|nr:hypothetical protein [Gaiellaceae bacterium]